MKKATYFILSTLVLFSLFSFTNKTQKWDEWSRSHSTGYRGITYQYRISEKKGEYDLQVKIKNTSGEKISHCIVRVNGEVNGEQESTLYNLRYLDNGFDRICPEDDIKWSSKSWTFNFDID